MRSTCQRSWWSRAARWPLALVILWLALAPLASAHADLVRSDPAAGVVYPVGSLSHVTLQFDEVLEPAFSSIEVHSSQLERVDAGEIQVDPSDPRILRVGLAELEPDIYTVTWLVVSTVDGHSTSGLFTFSVGLEIGDNVPSGAVPTPSTAAPTGGWEVGIRWLLFTAAMVAFGALLLVSTILGPSRRAIDGENEDIWPAIERNLSTLILGSALLWLCAGIASLGLQSVVVGRVGLAEAVARGVPLRLLGTRFGTIWAMRQLSALALLTLHWHSRNPQYFDRAQYKSPIPNLQSPIKLALAAALLGSLSLSSHGAAGALWPALATVADWIHLLANSAWIGGLFALTLAFMPALRRLPDERRRLVLMITLRRFSTLAVRSVFVVAATGAFSAALHFLLPADLVETPYGLTLLLKLGLVLLILLIGLANNMALRPEAIARLPVPGHWMDRWRTTLPRAIRIEALVGLLILLATALLTAVPTPPPRPLPTGQIPFNSELREVDLPEEQLKSFVALAPNWIGWNRYLVVLQDVDGNPIADAERVRLRFYLPEVEARTDWIITSPTQDGLYVASGQELVLVGDWQIEVDIRRSRVPDTRFTVDWHMAAPPTTLVDPAQPRLANWLALAGLVFTAAGLVAWQHIRNGKGLSPGQTWRRSSSTQYLGVQNDQLRRGGT
ncbi:MAG: CopD family protein [Anaerolineae bacterium]